MRISLANSIVPFNFSTIDEVPSVCAIMSLVPCNHTSVLITFLFALTFFPPLLSPSFSVFHPLTGLVVVGAYLAIISLLPLLLCFSFTSLQHPVPYYDDSYGMCLKKNQVFFFLMFCWLVSWLVG